jgi:hypothetical protein
LHTRPPPSQLAAEEHSARQTPSQQVKPLAHCPSAPQPKAVTFERSTHAEVEATTDTLRRPRARPRKERDIPPVLAATTRLARARRSAVPGAPPVRASSGPA